MKKISPRLSRFQSLLLLILFTSFTVLQGCDGLNGIDADDHPSNTITTAASGSDTFSKLRHANQLTNATRTRTGVAGKSTSLTTDLFVAYNTYEADGITPRIINKFEISNRILEEYGITRRVLSKYGITHRILNEYGITRRVLNQYGITKRVLDKYGITPRVLGRYGDLITDALLADFNITDAMLEAEGLTRDDLDDFNTLSELVNLFDITVEEFIDDLDAYIPDITLKIYIDGTRLGMSVSINESVLTEFLEEVETDNDILLIEPDMQINVSNLGRVSGETYDNQIIPWGLLDTRTPIPGIQTALQEAYIAENPVHVYLLDSGAMENISMDDINYVEKKDFTMLFENPEQLEWEENNAPDVSGFDPGDAGNPYDESGHGTHIAGTIGAHNNLFGVVGVAPSVRIHSLKVLNRQGQTDITTLMAAVDYVTRAKKANPDWPVVANLSLGVDLGTTEYNILDEAIAASIAEGVIFVVAAGNDGKDASTYSPAHVAEAITVGSYNENRQFSYFSNYGPAVDILAPGENIISLSHQIEDVKSFQSILNSGTSHAAPHITGAIARYLGQNPQAGHEEVLYALEKASKKTITGAPQNTTQFALNVKNLLPELKDKTLDNQESRQRYHRGRDSQYNDIDEHDTRN